MVREEGGGRKRGYESEREGRRDITSEWERGGGRREVMR